MYKENKIGPRTDPWGTPLESDKIDEVQSLKRTYCVLSEK